jgi:hypothetical protein
VKGDPVNGFDPTGLEWWDPNTNTLHGDPWPTPYVSTNMLNFVDTWGYYSNSPFTTSITVPGWYVSTNEGSYSSIPEPGAPPFKDPAMAGRRDRLPAPSQPTRPLPVIKTGRQPPPSRPSVPTDPTEWSNPLPPERPTGNYWDFLSCEAGRTAENFNSLAVGFTLVVAGMATRPTPGTVALSLITWGAVLNTSVRAPCVAQVYGQEPQP